MTEIITAQDPIHQTLAVDVTDRWGNSQRLMGHVREGDTISYTLQSESGTPLAVSNLISNRFALPVRPTPGWQQAAVEIVRQQPGIVIVKHH